MKRVLSMGILAALLLSSIAAGSSYQAQKNASVMEQTESCSVLFSSAPTFIDQGAYLAVSLEGTNALTRTPGLPVVPTVVKNFQIPSQATNIRVVYTVTMSEPISIPKMIAPAAPYVIDGADILIQNDAVVINEQVYSSDAWYPSSLYSYRVTCGRNDQNTLVNFVDIELYPVQYSPAGSEIRYQTGTGDILVTYTLPTPQVQRFSEEYALVIIAPSKFTAALQPLVDHKISIGVQTLLKPVGEIYDEFEGRDKPEQIKLFIKDAIENWNISSVLLVGGLKSHVYAVDREDLNQGSSAWWIPVRYTNIYLYNQYSAIAPIFEAGCPSDLYYSDVYKAGQVFDDWNSNGNSIFAEAKVDMQGYTNIIDTLDLRPDVSVSRLPCTKVSEVKTVVDKIITYEETSASEKPWYSTMLAIAGKTSRFYQGKPDGEFICDAAITSMGSLVDPVRLYVTNNDTGGPRPIPADIVREFKKGAGFIDFEGHGNPLRWDTIWADGKLHIDWAGGLRVRDFIKLTNGDKLPIVVIGGCHNGLFNVSLIQTFLDSEMFRNRTGYWTHGIPAPFCFAWGLCLLPKGGAIASIAGTGLGIGPGGGGTPLEYSAALESNFFYAIGQGGAQTFGEAHSAAIQKYIDDHPTLDAMDYHCISIYQPFGDPTMLLGGGSS